MKQKILAILCALALVLSAVPAAGALEGESARAAATLTALHVLDEQAAADPAAPFTRAQANALLVRLSGIQIESNTLDAAVDQGWTAVTSGQQEAIPAGEFFHGLLRLLGYTDIPADAARYARHIGLAVRDCSSHRSTFCNALLVCFIAMRSFPPSASRRDKNGPPPPWGGSGPVRVYFSI